jgi:hypothetical protein
MQYIDIKMKINWWPCKLYNWDNKNKELKNKLLICESAICN